LLARRPDLQFVDLRGNVDTRLGKITDGELDAVVLAAAGLHRLGHEDRISCYLDPNQVLPAPGQGALGLQTLASDSGAHRLLSALNDPASHSSVTAERAFLASLGGGCRAPIAAWARMEGDELRLDGSTVCRGTLTGSSEDAVRLGAQLGEQLMAEGALALMADAG
jgi:hydroxymethylbilane synthase